METDKPRIDALTVLEYFAGAPVDETRRTLALADLVTTGRKSADKCATPTNGAAARPRRAAPNAPARPTGSRAAQGERHGSAKVNAETVRRIRREYRDPENGRELATELGVSHTTIRSIAYRESWKHLPAEPGDFTPPDKQEPDKPDQSHTGGQPESDANRKANGESTGREPRTTGLGPQEAREIRREYLNVPIPAIAEKHQVSETTVVDVANRRSWRSVEPAPDEYMPPPEIEGTRLRRQPRLRPVPGAEERANDTAEP